MKNDNAVTMTPVPQDSPLMVAWEAYTATPDYVNSMRWLAHEEHRKGSMWAAFMAGWLSALVHAAHTEQP